MLFYCLDGVPHHLIIWLAEQPGSLCHVCVSDHRHQGVSQWENRGNKYFLICLTLRWGTLDMYLSAYVIIMFADIYLVPGHQQLPVCAQV